MNEDFHHCQWWPPSGLDLHAANCSSSSFFCFQTHSDGIWVHLMNFIVSLSISFGLFELVACKHSVKPPLLSGWCLANCLATFCKWEMNHSGWDSLCHEKSVELQSDRIDPEGSLPKNLQWRNDREGAKSWESSSRPFLSFVFNQNFSYFDSVL